MKLRLCKYKFQITTENREKDGDTPKANGELKNVHKNPAKHIMLKLKTKNNQSAQIHGDKFHEPLKKIYHYLGFIKRTIINH